MKRPLANRRPIGPLAQSRGRDNSRLGILVNYGRTIPEEKRDDAEDAVGFHFGASDIDIVSVDIGPENEYDSAMIITSEIGLEVDEVQRAASASVAELEDQGIKTGIDAPEVEVVLA